MYSEAAAWRARRDCLQAKINCQFTTKSARIKLKELTQKRPHNKYQLKTCNLLHYP